MQKRKTTPFSLLSILMTAGLAMAQGGGQRAGFFSVWTMPKMWIGALIAVTGIVLLARRKVTPRVRLFFLILAFFLFGVVSALPLGSFATGMGLHPSPMCVVEKPFLFLNAGRSIPIVFFSIFLFVAILTILGNKSFCGWVCPIGAIQEIVYSLPFVKKGRIGFRLSNATRVLVFVVFLVLLFTLDFTLYGYTNPFNMLHWQFSLVVLVPFAVVIILSLFFYRPFCYLFCPLGLVTWIVEHLSIVRVTLNRQACTDCKLCLKKSPCPAVQAILKEKISRPDCHACGICLESCPEDALAFKVRWLK